MKHDVIIIGSGLGGLVSGAILSKEGFKVCILEKNHQAGGNLQTFERDGHRFETGLHYIGSMDKGQTLHQFFKYAGLDGRLNLRRLDMEGYDRLTFGQEEEVYLHSQGWEHFEKDLVRHFPAEREAIREYVRRVRQTIKTIPLYDLENAGNYLLSPGHLQGCALGVISSLTKDTRLQSVLAGANSIYHGAAQRTPWYLHCCIRNSLVQSSWRPAEGSDQISGELVNIIRENGGTVATGSEAVHLEGEAGKITGVELKNGEFLEASYFISNAHPDLTLSWLDPGMVRRSFRNRVAGLENTPGFFSVYMVLKEKSLPYQNYNHFHYRSDDYFQDVFPDMTWPQTFLLYTPAHGEREGFATIASALTFMPFSQYSRWAGMEPSERGTEYREFKEEKTAKLLAAVENKYPGLKENIVAHYVSTPLTFKDYTGTKNGSAYGIMKDCHNPALSILSPRTRIPNLFFTGQNLNIHGVLGTTIGAVLTCSELLGFRELVKKIVNA